MVQGALGIPPRPKTPQPEFNPSRDLFNQNREIRADIANVLENQNRVIETLTNEIKDLKNMRRNEGEEQVREQVKRLEKLIEKRQKKAEEEEFHYELKRVRKPPKN